MCQNANNVCESGWLEKAERGGKSKIIGQDNAYLKKKNVLTDRKHKRECKNSPDTWTRNGLSEKRCDQSETKTKSVVAA